MEVIDSNEKNILALRASFKRNNKRYGENMKVDFFLIEQDKKTSIYHDEFKLGRIQVMPKITLQIVAQRTKRKIATDVKSYDSAIHVSADGHRYAVAFSGDSISAQEMDELIRTSVPKPLPLT